jgi:hypothetical protein
MKGVCMSSIPEMSLRDLADHAARAAEQMSKVARGKAPDAPTHSTAGTFASIATILSGLSTYTINHGRIQQVAVHALHRIANLEVRGAAELIEQENWKKLCIELQAVAEDALTKLRKIEPSSK